MSSFNLQAGQIRGALVAAGMPAQAATAIANILGNSAQALRHAGQVTNDRTPRNMRLVRPDDRRHSLRNLDFRAGDPDFRPQRVRASEERPIPEMEPDVLDSLSPQQAAAPFRIDAGAFIDVAANGPAARVNVRIQGNGTAVFADRQANTLVAKDIRAEANGGGNNIRFFIEEDGREAVWKLQLDGFTENVDVVTDVQYRKGVGLVVVKRKMSGWFSGEPTAEVIGLSRVPVVTDIQLSGNLIGNRRAVVVFEDEGAAASVVGTTTC